MPDTVTLRVAAVGYTGWQTVRITRSLEQLAGSFELAAAGVGPASGYPPPGAAVAVLIGETPVITGYIDEQCIDLDATSHAVSLAGRDKTADLVDCIPTDRVLASPADYRALNWQTTALARVASTVAAPHGIAVQDATGAIVSRAAVQPGETSFEFLERLARQNGVLLTTDGRGTLLITHAPGENSGSRLMEGVNILRARLESSQRERGSVYVALMQQPGHQLSATQAAHSVSLAQDTGVSRYRPMLVVAEDPSVSAARRVAWEATVRRGRGTRLTVLTPGWHGSSGALFAPGQLLTLDAPSLGLVAALLLVVSVDYRRDESGTVAELSLTDPAAFTLEKGLAAGALDHAITGRDGVAATPRKDRARRLKKKNRLEQVIEEIKS